MGSDINERDEIFFISHSYGLTIRSPGNINVFAFGRNGGDSFGRSRFPNTDWKSDYLYDFLLAVAHFYTHWLLWTFFLGTFQFLKKISTKCQCLSEYKRFYSKMWNTYLEGGYKLFWLSQNIAINKKSTIVVQSLWNLVNIFIFLSTLHF